MGIVSKYLRKWFVYWHGEGAVNQYDFYRCQSCHSLLTWNIMQAGGCARCNGHRITPTKPTWFEVGKLMVTPWLVK